MAIVTASGSAGSHNRKLLWDVVYDSVNTSIQLTVSQTDFNGTVVNEVPAEASVDITAANGTIRNFDFTSLRASTDSQIGVINKGIQSYPNVNFRISADRAALLVFTTNFTPAS